MKTPLSSPWSSISSPLASAQAGMSLSEPRSVASTLRTWLGASRRMALLAAITGMGHIRSRASTVWPSVISSMVRLSLNPVVFGRRLDEHGHVGVAGLGHEGGGAGEMHALDEVVRRVAEDVDGHLAGDEAYLGLAGAAQEFADRGDVLPGELLAHHRRGDGHHAGQRRD